MRVTLKDIAKAANVSVATVSLVLRNIPSRISEEKIREVKELAKEMGYIPNQNAVSLVTQKTHTIGVIIPDIENIFFSSLAKTVEFELRTKGYMTNLAISNEKYENDIELIDMMVGRAVDGILIALSNESEYRFSDVKDHLDNTKLPYVLMDRVPEEHNNSVHFDHRLGGELLASYVLEKGHRNIGVLSAREYSKTGELRWLGILDALKKYGMNEVDIITEDVDFTYLEGYEKSEALINENVSVIIAANDMVAYGAFKKLKELGKKVPDDISLVGYDNLYFSDILEVPLTSVGQNISALGKESVNLLMTIIEDKSYNNEVMMKPKLIIKDSLRDINKIDEIE